MVEGAGRVTGAVGLGASPRTPPAPAVQGALQGCFGWACVVLRHKLADSGTRGTGHPSGCWIPFLPPLLSIGAWRGARRLETRRYGPACGRDSTSKQLRRDFFCEIRRLNPPSGKICPRTCGTCSRRRLTDCENTVKLKLPGANPPSETWANVTLTCNEGDDQLKNGMWWRSTRTPAPRSTISARQWRRSRRWSGPRGACLAARTRPRLGLRVPCEKREPSSAPAKRRRREARNSLV